jgi:hypothetical protein
VGWGGTVFSPPGGSIPKVSFRNDRAELIKALRTDDELRVLLQLSASVKENDRAAFEAVFQGMDVDAGRVLADGALDLDDETRHVHRSLSHELIAGTPPSPHPNTTHQHRRLVRHTASIPGSFQYQYETFLH